MESMTAFVDELMKIGQSGLIPLLRKGGTLAMKHAKPAALVGAGGATILGGQRLIEDVRMAEAMRKRMSQAGY